jgi:hypothetical protein
MGLKNWGDQYIAGPASEVGGPVRPVPIVVAPMDNGTLFHTVLLLCAKPTKILYKKLLQFLQPSIANCRPPSFTVILSQRFSVSVLVKSVVFNTMYNWHEKQRTVHCCTKCKAEDINNSKEFMDCNRARL